MATVAVIMDDWFEDVEYTQPAAAFEKAGHELVIIGLEKGKVVTGKRQKVQATIQRSLGDVSVDEFDALLIPGGYSPDRLRAHEMAVQFVKDFTKSGKPVFSICHAPQILITADVLKNRRITGYKSIIQDIKNAGAEFIDKEVVVDGNLVSSRDPGDIPAFIRESLQKL
ncbi:type 1 glutamine amidotransferase domain-containing protein [Methanobacterium sp. CWC-01]|uniref:type 1 glutamine amidotransferase domain-containing protein n=1 Tax=Methanobacterium aridiramus TaxID=2584467 RepID=UPI002576F8A1|nr:type 1 glutamine amidotransferase domain-containing protein [Methanobacterium sp. CWC-01]